MAKYVKTDYVPENYYGLFTENKEYLVEITDGDLGYIICDIGKIAKIRFVSCAHLGGRRWTVINR